MPPANSPEETPFVVPSSTNTSPDLVQQLEAISLPVPDLAATLSPHALSRDTGQTAMSNTRPTPANASPSSANNRNRRQAYATEDEFQVSGRWTADYTMNPDPGVRRATTHSYSNRTPARQSIYDWAASGGDSETEDDYEITASPRLRLLPDNNHEQDTASLLSESRRWRTQLRRELEPRDEPSGRVTLPPLQHMRRNAQSQAENIGDSGTAERSSTGRSPSVTAALSRLIERQRFERGERDLERQRRPESTLWLSERMLESQESERLSEAQREVLRRIHRGYHATDESYSSSASNLEAARERADRQEAQLRALRQRDERTLQGLRAARERNQRLDKHRQHHPSMPKTVGMIRYLSALRGCPGVSEALDYAKELGVSRLYSTSPSLTTPSELLLSTGRLQPPQPSSFLQPGTTFTGTQRSPLDPPAAMLSRDRDYLRRMVANRNLNRSSTNLRDSMSALMDAERYVSDLLEENADSGSLNSAARRSALYTHPLWLGERGSRHQHSYGQSQTPSPPVRTADSWPVQVTFHTVSLHRDEMKITGSMLASRIPDKLPPTSPDHRPEGSSMESFFEGEIIDFRKWSLETQSLEDSNPESDDFRPQERYTYRPGYRSGGVNVDASYWRGIGPFKAIAAKVKKRKLEAAIAHEMSKGVDEDKITWTEEQVDELEVETDEEIAKHLGNTAWFQKTLGGAGQWILMRWKERCFTSPMPSCTTPSTSDALRNMQNHTHAPPRYASYQSTSNTNTNGPTSTSTNNPSATNPATSNNPPVTDERTPSSLPGCYGLTINGYYYIALHRQSGRIEGLYYDSGSTPFQELRLSLEGGHVGPDRDLHTEQGGSSETQVTDGGSDHDTAFEAGLGVKRWFPSVEAR